MTIRLEMLQGPKEGDFVLLLKLLEQKHRASASSSRKI